MERKKIETEKIVEAESKKLIKINKIKVRKDSSIEARDRKMDSRV